LDTDCPGLSSYWSDDFQRQDFESVWNLAEPLTDEEKDLFSADNMDMLVQSQDPVLTTAGLEDIVSAPLVDFLPADPDSTSSDMVVNDVITDVVKQEVDDDDMEDPVDILNDYPISIHSYSLPPTDFRPEDALAGDEIHYTDSDESEPVCSPPPPVLAPQGCRKRQAPPTAAATPTSQRRSNRQPKRRKFSGDSETDSEDENESVNSKQQNSGKPVKKDTFSNGKKKLYKSGPFHNPEMERARMNAINAKRNRDRKKQERQRLEQEMDRLKSENQGLKRTANKMKERAANAEAQLEKIREMLRANNLEAVLKATGNASL